MKIGVTSQNLRTVTGHASKARSFLVYEATTRDNLRAIAPLELPMHLSMHAWDKQGEHPLLELDYLLTGPCGRGFIQHMKKLGVRVRITNETDPQLAVENLLARIIPPPRQPGALLHQ